jgi:hypothetical protein
MKKILVAAFCLCTALQLFAQRDKTPYLTICTVPFAPVNPDANVQISVEKYIPNTKWSVLGSLGYVYDYSWANSIFQSFAQVTNFKIRTNGIMFRAEGKYHFNEYFYGGPYLFTKYMNVNSNNNNGSNQQNEVLNKTVIAGGMMLGFNTNISEQIAFSVNSGLGSRFRNWRINGQNLNLNQSSTSNSDLIDAFSATRIVDYFFTMRIGVNLFKD